MSAHNALNEMAEGFLHDQAKDPPDLLWHYTNAAGFLGIFRSGKLWATNTGYLNDASEMGYARIPLLQAVRDRRSGKDDTTEQEMLDLLCDSAAGPVTRPFFKHPHDQIFALPKIPTKQEKESQDGIVVTLGLQ